MHLHHTDGVSHLRAIEIDEEALVRWDDDVAAGLPPLPDNVVYTRATSSSLPSVVLLVPDRTVVEPDTRSSAACVAAWHAHEGRWIVRALVDKSSPGACRLTDDVWLAPNFHEYVSYVVAECERCTPPPSAIAPPRVRDVQEYWTTPPPELSARCRWWQRRIRDGWRPNRRVRAMGYYERAEYFGVYIWEMLNVLDVEL